MGKGTNKEKENKKVEKNVCFAGKRGFFRNFWKEPEKVGLKKREKRELIKSYSAKRKS